MRAQHFFGTGVAVATPFLPDGQVDYPGFKKLIDHIIDGKVEYLVILGTTGESATIHGDEKQRVLSFVAEVNAQRVPLVAGIGGYDTNEVLMEMDRLHLEGYEAILSVSPYYNKPSQEGLYQHYKALDEHTPLPIIMYNVPGRTGMNVSAETTLRIATHCRNIIATKEASGNFEQIMQIIKYKPEGFEIISGDDLITLPMIACGAAGVISVVANAYPELFSDMVRYCLSGDFQTARHLHYQLSEIIPTLFAEGSPSGLKAYLKEMGICGDTTRLPVVPVSAGLQQKIKSLMKEVGKKNYTR